MSLPIWPLAAVVVLLGYGILTWNRFVGLGQRRLNAFSDIDVQLKRRWDLVPALVETVQGYAGHEHEVLAATMAARTRAMAAPGDPDSAPRRGEQEAGLAGALRDVFVVVEAYPALKADRNFLELHRGLVAIEDDLQAARRYHNAVVRDVNTLRQSVPAGLVGRLAGVKPAAFFQVDDDQRAVPAVSLAPTDPAPRSDVE